MEERPTSLTDAVVHQALQLRVSARGRRSPHREVDPREAEVVLGLEDSRTGVVVGGCDSEQLLDEVVHTGFVGRHGTKRNADTLQRPNQRRSSRWLRTVLRTSQGQPGRRWPIVRTRVSRLLSPGGPAVGSHPRPGRLGRLLRGQLVPVSASGMTTPGVRGLEPGASLFRSDWPGSTDAARFRS